MCVCERAVCVCVCVCVRVLALGAALSSGAPAAAFLPGGLIAELSCDLWMRGNGCFARHS